MTRALSQTTAQIRQHAREELELALRNCTSPRARRNLIAQAKSIMMARIRFAMERGAVAS